MGTYGLDGVIKAWELEQLTSEQAIGQILQLVAEIEERVRHLERGYRHVNRTRPALTFASQSDGETDPKNAR
jgi:hypothetical protein